ncbi:MAG TPA: hypothetical protein VFC99_03530 [Acidimicrobiia bacterium]|nr:hypothetical protein [Acidimicrobiia bacterium]
MDRGHQPAMRWDADRARPIPRLGSIRWLRRTSAVVRWAFLVVACGLLAAAVVALAASAAATLVDGLS